VSIVTPAVHSSYSLNWFLLFQFRNVPCAEGRKEGRKSKGREGRESREGRKRREGTKSREGGKKEEGGRNVGRKSRIGGVGRKGRKSKEGRKMYQCRPSRHYRHSNVAVSVFISISHRSEKFQQWPLH
jgi:hypothetical protein